MLFDLFQETWYLGTKPIDLQHIDYIIFLIYSLFPFFLCGASPGCFGLCLNWGQWSQQDTKLNDNDGKKKTRIINIACKTWFSSLNQRILGRCIFDAGCFVFFLSNTFVSTVILNPGFSGSKKISGSQISSRCSWVSPFWSKPGQGIDLKTIPLHWLSFDILHLSRKQKTIALQVVVCIDPAFCHQSSKL